MGDAINNDSDSVVNASVINDADTGESRLVLEAKETGSYNNFESFQVRDTASPGEKGLVAQMGVGSSGSEGSVRGYNAIYSVNGEMAQLWNLKAGDLITLGRSVLLVGSKEDIARRIKNIKDNQNHGGVQMGFIQDDLDEDSLPAGQSIPMDQHATTTGMLEELIFQGLDRDDMQVLHVLLPPELPARLDPRQTAEILELLQYFYLRIRYLVTSVEMDENKERVSLSTLQWQNLLDLYDRVAQYMRNITEP